MPESQAGMLVLRNQFVIIFFQLRPCLLHGSFIIKDDLSGSFTLLPVVVDTDIADADAAGA